MICGAAAERLKRRAFSGNSLRFFAATTPVKRRMALTPYASPSADFDRGSHFTFRIYAILAVSILLLFAALSAPALAQTADDSNLVVTTLGTGTPSLKPNRFGAANLVQAGGLNILIDAGRGTSIRLQQAGVPPGKIDAVFLTHFHSDHVNGLADLFTIGFIKGGSLRRRVQPFQLYGPAGTKRLADGLRLAHKSDIDTRMLDENVPEIATQIDVHEMEEGVIFDKNGVKVTIFPVLHGEKIKPASGYRVDYKGKSVVFSGDTKYDRTLVKYGKGVDLLIHELGMSTPELAEKPAIQTILNHHTSPEDAGIIFRDAAPNLAVYSHMVLLGLPPISEVITRTRTNYDGPLVIAEDLMQVIISDQGLSILKAGQ